MKFRAALTALARFVVPAITGIVFLAFLVAIVAWMAGMFDEKIEPGEVDVTLRQASAEQKANAYAVRQIEKDYIIEAVGTLKAASRTEISSRVLATIEKINVRAGTTVEASEELIRLDRRALEADLSQVQAAVAAAEAAVSRAENDYRRAKQLFESRTISRAEYDKNIEAVRVARAKRKQAQEAISAAQVMLSYATIKAPKAGTIVDRLAEEGDTARPGAPLLVLYDPGSLRLEVPVMEALALKLKVGDPLDVLIDARDRTVTGTVDEIVPQAEAASRSFLVKLALPRSDDLFEGMFGRLRIPAGQRQHLCLHIDTIANIGQLTFVEVIGPDDQIERRFIKTGRLGDPKHVEVLSGLKVGEQVIMRPSSQ